MEDITKKIIYVDVNNKEKLIECSKEVQEGKLRWLGYNMEQFMYLKIN